MDAAWVNDVLEELEKAVRDIRDILLERDLTAEEQESAIHQVELGVDGLRDAIAAIDPDHFAGEEFEE